MIRRMSLTAASSAFLVAALAACSTGGPAPLDDAGATLEQDAGATLGRDGGDLADAGAQTTPDAGSLIVGGDCNDNDPLTNADWVGFCGDRVDDNCQVDSPSANCTQGSCATGDEDCPATQPASGPPSWDCIGTPPANVIAFAHFAGSNAQVLDFCVFVYESTAFAGEHYVATSLNDGADTNGPNNFCRADKSARRHFYLSDLFDDQGASTNCAPVRYTYPGRVDDQKLSNSCRKAMRNIARGAQADFSPEIQYFAASRAEAEAKLDVLDSAEVACLGIDNTDGEPYRTGEIWVTQAVQALTRVQ